MWTAIDTLEDVRNIYRKQIIDICQVVWSLVRSRSFVLFRFVQGGGMSRSWWRTSIGIVLLGLIDSGLSAADAADVPAASAPAAGNGDEELTEIVVSGLIE